MKNSSYAEAELERSVEEQDLLSWHRVLVQRWITFWRGEERRGGCFRSYSLRKRKGMGGAGWSSESWRECKQE